MNKRLNALAARIDAVSIAVGEATAWLTLAMVLVTLVVVVLRYVFGVGLIWLQEMITWMHGVVFMLGAAYALSREEHVRVDVFYRNMSPKRRAIVDVFGVLLFLLPFCGYVFFQSLDYVASSWLIREVSRDAGGLPFPLIPLLKTALLVMPLAVALQGLSLLVTALSRLRED